jgi:Ca2+/Na+ antiporter
MIAVLITIVFAFLCAKIEAIIWEIHSLYASFRHKTKSKEIHFLLVLFRCFFGLLILPFITKWEYILICFGVFFYIHPSAMYRYRNKMNKYIYTSGWFSRSSGTSESWLDRKFPFTGTYEFRTLILMASFLLTIVAIRK